MPVVKLDANFIANSLICPPDKLKIEYCCEEVKGLFVCVTAATPGHGTYYYRTKNSEGITRTLKVGRSTDLSLKDAKIRARALRSELEMNRDSFFAARSKSRDMPTLSDFFNDSYMPMARVHKRSWVRDVQLFVRINKAFGHLKLDKLVKQKVVSFHAGLLNENLSPASADHHAKLLRRLLSVACEYGLLEKNILVHFKMLNVDNRVENYLREEQLEKLLHVLQTDANRPVCLIAMMLLSTGCRLNEILSAKWTDVDIRNHVLLVKAVNSKSRKNRAVPLNPSALGVLAQLDTEGKFDHVFINKQTFKPYTTITKVWDRLRIQANLPHLRIHDLRHNFSYLTLSSDGSTSLYSLQRILGHANPLTTLKYAGLSQKVLQDASDGASSMILNAMKRKPAEVEHKPA